MKYNDNGEYKDIYVKAFDTLPIGTEVDYDGSVVPSGWTQVDEVVWTNPDTTASFSGTTITLNDTYSKIEILFKRSAGETNQFNLVVYNDNNNTIMAGVSNNLLCTRQVKLDGTTLQIANGFRYNTYGSSATQDNSVLIPYQVIGYK